MKHKIQITKKIAHKGEDGHKVISVRMKGETIDRLDALSAETNRSRNELINILIETSLEDVCIVEDEQAPYFNISGRSVRPNK